MELLNHKSSYFFCNQEKNHIFIELEKKYKIRLRILLHEQTYYQDPLYSHLPAPLFFHTLLFEKAALSTKCQGI